MNLAFEFTHPERLWWLVAAPVIALVAAWFGARRRPWPATMASIVLRTALAAIPMLLLAEPERTVSETVPGRLTAIVDWSRSVTDAARTSAVERVAAWSRRAGCAARIIAFGERARVVASWGPEGPASRPLAHGDDLASDPAPALDLARALRAPEGVERVVLFTDGAIEEPVLPVDVGPTADPLVIPLLARGERNVRVTALVTKPAGGEGDRLVAAVRGSASAASKGTIHIFVDGAEQRVMPAEVAAGEFTVDVPLPPLEPGRRVIGAWFESGDDEPLDDEAGTTVVVRERPLVLVVSPDGRSLVASALKAQEIPTETVTAKDFLARPELVDRGGVVVLDRVPIDDLSAAPVVAAVEAFVQRGGGLLFLPRENPGELVSAPARRFLGLLPLTGRPLEPAKKEDPPKAPPDEPGAKPPDPDKKKPEKREAPTLGLLLLIDRSGSMKGQSLRLAKQAAIAAADVLHPEDRIGVVAFNDEPIEVLEMSPAGNREHIKDRISRIQAGGGTDFGPALDEARAIFAAEKLKIKHCVLISDGESRPGKLIERVEDLVREGVTLSTVGIGTDARFDILSELAARGHGKFQPAYTAEEIPQVITVEAERVVTQSGARRRVDIRDDQHKPEDATPAPPRDRDRDRPPPTPAEPGQEPARKPIPIVARWPAAYLKGVRPETAPGIFAWHRVEAHADAWVALATAGGDPLLLHTYRGFGRVVAATVPFEGLAAGPLVQWDDYANLFGQVARYLLPASTPQRLQVTARATGRLVTVDVVDVEGTAGDATRFEIDVRDQRGRALALPVRQLAPRRFDFVVPPTEPVAWAEVKVRVVGEPGRGHAAVRVDPPPEVVERGPRLSGLQALALAVHGRFVPAPPEELPIAAATREKREPAGAAWLLALPFLFLADLLVKRLWRGQVP